MESNHPSHNPYRAQINERLVQIFGNEEFVEIPDSNVSPIRHVEGKVKRKKAVVSEGFDQDGQRKIHLSIREDDGINITTRYYSYYPQPSRLETWSFSPPPSDPEDWPNADDYLSREEYQRALESFLYESFLKNYEKTQEEKALGLREVSGIEDWEAFSDAVKSFRRPRSLRPNWLRAALGRGR